MAEVKSNLIELEVVYSKLNKALDENINRLNIGAVAVDNYNKKISVVPSEFQKSLVDIKTKTDAVTQSTKQLEQAEKKIQQERVKELQLQKQREQAIDKYNASLEKQALAEQNARKKQVQGILDQSKALNSLEAQKQKELASLEKENSKLAIASNAYNKLQAELSKLQFAYQNLAVRKEQGATLTKAEAQQYDYLKNRIQQHDKTLKAVDATMGKHQRNVGNYASAFNPLSNSINQLTREAPAFANSVQTGFMAISNNLPIFFDAISQTTKEVNMLKKAGQETPSVMSRLASSLFSFQTLLSVGVTLLTVYGAKIIDWVSNLGNANDKLIEMIRLQEELDNSRRKSIVKVTSEIKEYERALSIISDKKQKKDYRIQEIKDLRSNYYYYLKDITDGELLEQKTIETKKKVAAAFNEIKKAITAQDKASETNNILKTNEERLLKLKEEEKLRANEINDLDILNKKLQERRDFLYKNNQGSLATSGNDEVTNSIRRQITAIEQERKVRLKKYDEQKDILLADENSINITNEILALETRLVGLRQVSLNNTNASIGLRIKEEKGNKDKIKELKELADLQIEQADFLSREFELRKKIYENSIEANKAIFDDEKNTLKDRLIAYEQYMSLKEQLIKAEYVEQNRIIDEEFKSQTESINQAYNDQIKQINKGVIDGAAKRIQAEAEKNKALTALEKKYYIDRNINYEDFEKAQKGIRDEYAKEVELATIERLAKLEQTNEASQAKLYALRNRDFDAGTLTKETPLSSFKKYYESKAKIEEDARVDSLNRDIATNETKLQNLALSGKTESEEYKKLTAEKRALELQLQEIKDANTEKEVKKLEEYKKLLIDTYKGFIDDFSADSGFGKLIEILDGGLDKFTVWNEKLQKFETDTKAVALTVSEAFQEAFNTISEASQANYDAEYERLEAQKEISMQFAGESTAAKEEIERQYEERKRAIARREAEAQKRLAMFNIAINIAQAIMATYAKLGFPKGIPAAIAVGAIGAVQLAMTASREIPAFWKGTDNAPEGWALTQEKGAEVITDKYGKVKTYGTDKGAQMTYLSKGDKVYNAQKSEAYINNELAKNGIMPMRQSIINYSENNGLSKDDFNNGISKLAKTIKNGQPTNNTQVFLNNKQINTDYYKGKIV